MDEARMRHLEMIQGVINRLAGNCFSLKAWSVTVLAALFALSAKDANQQCAIVALLPTVAFWGLNAYYLRRERLSRALHDQVARTLRSEAVDRPVPLFSMDTAPVGDVVASWSRTLGSPTVFWMHAPLIAVVTAWIAWLTWTRTAAGP